VLRRGTRSSAIKRRNSTTRSGAKPATARASAPRPATTDALRDENLPIDVLDMAEPTEQRLLEVGALGRYDRELKQAWERFFLGADPQALTIPLGACANAPDGHL
jgi:hypothetical protein